MAKQTIRTPIKYYGGKTNMLDELLPLLDNDKSKLFVSLFTGGAAVEFAKQPHPVEIWNDKLNPLGAFYEVCATPYLLRKLRRKLYSTLYTEKSYILARHYYKLYRNRSDLSSIEKVRLAFGVYWMCNCTFVSQIMGGYAFSYKKSHASRYYNKIKMLKLFDYVKRMQTVTMFNRDAIALYDMSNKPNTIFYVDPPYVGSDMGHYDGYTLRDYNRLLWRLSECKGKFILSSYDSELLRKYSAKHKWYTKRIEYQLSAGTDKTKRKIECVTTNFNPVTAVNETISLFGD